MVFCVCVCRGTSGFETVLKDRPQFQGEEAPDGSIMRSYVDNMPILYYPAEKRLAKQFISALIIFGCILTIVAVYLVTFFLLKRFDITTSVSRQIESTDPETMESAQYLIFAILTPSFSYLFNYVATFTTDFENYQNDVEYEDALITKFLIFQVFNNFTPLFFVSFAKKPLFNDCINDDCTQDIRALLISIFFVRYCIMFIEVIVPIMKYVADTNIDNIAAQSTSVEESVVAYDDPELKYFSDEMYRYEYPGPFNDYAETCIQFGYITLFASVVPLIATLSIIENLVKMRLGAYKLCSYARRPFPELVEDIGMWNSLMDTMGILGFVVNTALIVFSTDSFERFPMMERIIIFLVAEQSLLIYKIALTTFFPSPPGWIDEITKRIFFVEQKYQFGVDDEVEDSSDNIKGNLDDPVDIDRITLFDIRKEKLNQETYKEIEQVEDKRRMLLKELRGVKEQLQEAYKTESFNDVTGIGETKHGLPLGRLTVKLLEIQQYMSRERPSTVKIRISIEWSGKRGGTPPGPPIGPYSYSRTVELSPAKGVAVFDQAVGPFAPIKTLDADVIFDILDGKPEMNNAVVAKATISLRELQDQLQTQKTLTVRIPKMGDDDDPQAEVQYDYATLFVVLQFQYSKVQPLRTKIYHIQDEVRGAEKRLAELKTGNSAPGDD